MGEGGTHHIVIYGPPAAGKLTVAQSLSDRYALALLDNHLSVDVALRLFDFGTKEFGQLVDRLRAVLFDAAASAGRHSVATFCYAHPLDRPYIERILAAAREHDVVMTFVQLAPPRAVLESRVVEASRAARRKVRDTELLGALLDRWDLYTPIHSGDLRIDNSEIPPDDVADRIARHVQLELSPAGRRA